MTTQISCAYTTTATGIQTPTTLNANLAAVALDTDFLNQYGLRVLSDTTATSGTAVTRTIVLGMVDSADATATATLVPGDGSGSPINTVTVGSAGADYIGPPIVAPAAQANVVRKAQLHSTLGVASASVTAGGAAYTAATVVTFVGGNLAPGGKVAKGTVTLAANVVVAVNVTDAGGPYAIAPTAVISDTGGGSGAIIAVHMGVTAVVIDDPGVGYSSPPAIGFTPQYKALFPDSSNQGAPVANWMTQVFAQALRQPVIAAAPVVS